LFDPVCQEGKCATLRKFNISQGIVNAIEALYPKSSAVLIEDAISKWFSTQVGVRHGCIISPTIEYIVMEALKLYYYYYYYSMDLRGSQALELDQSPTPG